MSVFKNVKKIFQAIRAKKEKINLPETKRRWTIFQQIDHYLQSLAPNSRRRFKSVLNEFCSFLEILKDTVGEQKFLSITVNDAQIYLNYCKAKPAQPGRSQLIGDTVAMSTVKNKATIMYCIFKALQDRDLISKNPFTIPMNSLKNIATGDRRPTKVTPVDKVEELLNLKCEDDSESRRDRAILAVSYGGGLRRSEVYNLRIIDVQRQDNVALLTLRQTKKQRADIQALPNFAGEIILEFLKYRVKTEHATELQPLFTMYKGSLPTNKFIDPRTFARIFQRNLAKVGLGAGYSCHSARKTAITRLLQQGTPIEKVSVWARHSSIEMTQRYNANQVSATAEVAKILDYQSQK